ncbi:ABC transporter ATP-binding protein [Brachybacterium saurashtrense]|uniref:ABC transporter ATP-binding protein n=1 Tax=Brachybacterium saurashtrense TaxID=556288 RepID=A0A345YQ52_9MICO|nr:ABC transporter ATP-binding protein [Brachybacterium saurashtrense]AXK46054.1 ABC transporter ATP-binding protein [Brachybacterium saurashtrense]RRR23794.1 ABC transporter ATP-binding protein [Brachybacterium saurashtrense]
MPDSLMARSLTLRYDQRTIVDGLDLMLPEGRITVVLGANACGKSTLLRGLARLLTPAAGRVLLGGRDVRDIGPKALARRIGFLPQAATAPGGVTVAELVARGRYPHQRLLQQWSKADAEAVAAAMRATGVEVLRDRVLDELSGGQRQRAWIAMLLAQQTPVMLLDEPTTYLDIAHQLEVLELCRRLNREEARTVVLVLHDLDQACRYADHLVVMREGRVLASGAPAEIMTTELVAEAFGVDALVQPHPVTGTPMIVPIAPVTAPAEVDA